LIIPQERILLEICADYHSIKCIRIIMCLAI
jgi:hypothetical protein